MIIMKDWGICCQDWKERNILLLGRLVNKGQLFLISNLVDVFTKRSLQPLGVLSFFRRNVIFNGRLTPVESHIGLVKGYADRQGIMYDRIFFTLACDFYAMEVVKNSLKILSMDDLMKMTSVNFHKNSVIADFSDSRIFTEV